MVPLSGERVEGLALPWCSIPKSCTTRSSWSNTRDNRSVWRVSGEHCGMSASGSFQQINSKAEGLALST